MKLYLMDRAVMIGLLYTTCLFGYVEQQAKEQETLADSIKGKDKNKIPRPDIAPKQPTYTSKAPKK